MGELDIITGVFVVVDEWVKELALDPEPGPASRLSLSELLTLAILHPLLKPFISLKRFRQWVRANGLNCFPA